ncbi:hypothetical protein SCG7086_AH_00160 [Chlamydiales bacterium SCGC AG-110-P3]|nr:hypothetical protein SCG7086_AH_00160 [Chlamydiales bacterium SCGC AG-110-P3]
MFQKMQCASDMVEQVRSRDHRLHKNLQHLDSELKCLPAVDKAQFYRALHVDERAKGDKSVN